MLPISIVDDVDFGFRNFRARLMMERRREVVIAVEIFLDRLGRCRVSSCCCSKVLLLSLSFVMLLVSTSMLADDGTSCTVAVDKLACEWPFSVVLMLESISIAMGEWMIYRT